ncbi:MAG: hypothetical protein PHH46_03295 [Firmicutes bacterium]|nr:hypothetical protein [Bacillota bacterium]
MLTYAITPVLVCYKVCRRAKFGIVLQGMMDQRHSLHDANRKAGESQHQTGLMSRSRGCTAEAGFDA